MNNKSYKCIFCSKAYVSKPALYEHMEKNHKEQLEGLTPAHYYFDYRNKNTTHKGLCVQCRKNPTEFNEKTEKYNRFCSDKCKTAYRNEFKKRMINKYGKVTLLDDVNMQKRMLANRKISGTYTWSDGTKFTYTGSYEKDCLEFLDTILNLPSKEVFFPAPQIFQYEFEGKNHFYMPDFFLSCYNIIGEVKGTNNHYQKRDIEIQNLKEEVVRNSEKELGLHYVMVFDKKYDELMEAINEYK